MRAAIVNSGFLVPPGHLLVNMAPADMRKSGVAFELAIALAMLVAWFALPGVHVTAVLIGLCVIGLLLLERRSRPRLLP